MSSSLQNNDVVTSDVSADVSRVTGCVKWFNNKAGYGFITVADGHHAGDVFVHHSAINVNEEQYRFLVQGEYVEFECVPVENGPHKWQASHVTGPNSGRLMCETRRVMRSSQPQSSHSDHPRPRPERSQQEWQVNQSRRQARQTQTRPQTEGHDQQFQSRRPYQSRSRPPYQPNGDEYEWLLVRKQAQGSRPPVRRARRVTQQE